MNTKNTLQSILFICLAACFASCKGKVTPEPSPTPGSEDLPKGVVRYVTKADQSILFATDSYDLGGGTRTSNMVNIYTEDKKQTIVGFGAAMTGASCYNILKLSSSARREFLKEIFDPKDGLGSSLIRVSIGASDFSIKSEFTWCDTEGIENFAIPDEDRKYLVPVLQDIYKINPNIKIIASPWSAPRWMKKTNSWTSSGLDSKYYDDYAKYFVKWIQAMEGYGFDIYAITIQNEPLNKGNSMSMYMPWMEQRDFIKLSLGKAFAEAKIKAKILVFDHNYNYDNISSQVDYPLNIYNDPEASQYVAGSAWHNYGGHVSTLEKIRKNAPDKEIYFTESSIGDWNHGQPGGFANCFMGDFEGIFMGSMYYGCKGVTLWNLLLDTSNGPHRGAGACSTCYGVATIDTSTGTITKRNSHYYNIAHASKVIKQGAVRVGAGGYTSDSIGYQAFMNPNGTIGVIIINKGASDVELIFKAGKKAYAKVPARSVVSLLWNDKE